jgi:membrane protein implicated in regulation of membrane protease activity
MMNLYGIPFYLLWLAAAALFLLLSIVGLRGFGMVAAAISSVAVSSLLYLGYIPPGNILMQTLVWAGLTFFLGLILNPVSKRIMLDGPRNDSAGHIGQICEVVEHEIVRGHAGIVLLDDERWNAALDPLADATLLKPGDEAEITHVKDDGTFLLRPVLSRMPEETL